MDIFKVDCGTFMCDAGALFGVIPRPLWSRSYPSDEHNRCQLQMRNMLVVFDDRKILIDAGSGMNFSDKYIRNNGVKAEGCLQQSLANIGVGCDEVTDVIFTHLHWDHSCGAFDLGSGVYGELFRNANYYVSQKQWDNACANNPRENAAYHSKDLDLMEKSGRLHLLSEGQQCWPNKIDLYYMDGHTPGQIIPVIHHPKRSVVFTADFIPTLSHVSQLWIAAYDLFPLAAMKEKEEFVNSAQINDWALFFQHDAYTESATLERKDGIVKGVKTDLSFIK